MKGNYYGTCIHFFAEPWLWEEGYSSIFLRGDTFLKIFLDEVLVTEWISNHALICVWGILIKDVNSIFQNTSKLNCGLQLDWFHRGSWVQPEIFLRHNNSNTEWDPFFGTQSLPKSHPSGSTYWCKKSKDKLLGRCTGNGGRNCKSQRAEFLLSNRPSWWTTLQIFYFFHIPGDAGVLTCTSRTTHHSNLMAPPPKSPLPGNIRPY